MSLLGLEIFRPLQKKKKRLLLIVVGTCVMLYMGVFIDIHEVFIRLFEKDFYSEFTYPVIGDISVFVSELKKGRKPSHEPINWYNYTFIYNCQHKCGNDGGSIQIVYIVKSAINHFHNRLAIRQSWGDEHKFPNKQTRIVFVVGIDEDNPASQGKIAWESEHFGDMVQGNFTDSYYNNTIKTVMEFKWVISYCPNARFYFFVDDDFYVSTPNVLKYIKDPICYPKNCEHLNNSVNIHLSSNTNNTNLFNARNHKDNQKLLNNLDFEFQEKQNVRFYSGFLQSSAPPVRDRYSKWYISLSEYPYHKYPPFISAGAYIISKEVLVDLYHGLSFTKHFRFDDVFLGLVAFKLKTKLYHCNEIYDAGKYYDGNNYHYVVASHNYSDPNKLLEIWKEQHSLGNA